MHKRLAGSLALVCVTFLVSSSVFAAQPLPEITPGTLCTDTDPNFDGYRYNEQIAHCHRNVTHQMKLEIAHAYGDIPPSEWSNYEFDHLIPLNAGGANDISNLWPEPIDEAHEKDKLELEIFDGLTSGTLTQSESVQMIHDWISSHFSVLSKVPFPLQPSDRSK